MVFPPPGLTVRFNMRKILLHRPVQEDFWSGRQDSNLRHLRLRRRFAVPDKIFGLALFLDFIDRCTKMLVLHLPPAADKHFAQSKCLALFASYRRPNRQRKTQREPPTRGSSLCVVRTTGFEPAASCSQSKRSTKLSHVRIIGSQAVLYTRNLENATAICIRWSKTAGIISQSWLLP